MIIETERLILREWQANDLEKMAEINADPEVMRYFPSTKNTEETKSFIERMQNMMSVHAYCYFATELKLSGEFIGFIGLAWQDYESPFTPCTDIGWRLKKEHWGKGYATEGAGACLKYAFDQLKLSEVYSVASSINLPSITVMKKIGMKAQLDFIHPALKDDERLKNCVCYKIQQTNQK